MFLKREREREREKKDRISLTLAENAYSTCVHFYIFALHPESRKKGKEKKRVSQVNHVKTILTFRDIKSMYFYSSEDFSKVEIKFHPQRFQCYSH